MVGQKWIENKNVVGKHKCCRYRPQNRDCRHEKDRSVEGQPTDVAQSFDVIRTVLHLHCENAGILSSPILLPGYRCLKNCAPVAVRLASLDGLR